MKTFTVFDMPQRSPEWFQARLGKLTGSRAADMLAKVKEGEAAKRRDLRMQLVCERLTGKSQEDNYVNAEMQRGIDMEATALAAYEVLTGNLAMPVGFCERTDLKAGCSPDGVIGDYEGLLSVKCPKTFTHVGYLRGRGMPAAYVPQMLHELWVTGAQYYDFLSYDDRLPEGLQTLHVRVLRDEAAIAEYAQKATTFLEEVDREESALRGWSQVA